MIDQITERLIEHLSAHLSGVEVDAYSDIRPRTPLPCARLRLDQIEPSDRQPGNGQTSVVCQFELFVVSAPEIAGAHITLQMLCAQAIHALHHPVRLLPNISTIKVSGASENGFDADFDGYLVWQVSFAVTVLLGDVDSWTVPGLPPQAVYVDLDPSTERNPAETYEVLDV